MPSFRQQLCAASVWLAFLLASTLITGCGGGGTSQPPPIQPSFRVSVSPSTVILTQGGSSQSVQVSITAQNGFTGLVSVTSLGLPNGVAVSPASLSLAPDVPGTLTFSASVTAGVVQTSSTIEGVSGSLKSDASLQFSVTGAPVPDPFHMIGGEFSHGFYDQARQLLFVANPGLNELDVVSGTDLSVRSRVAAPQPWGIDQMADGETLVIGTDAQGIVTVDENTLVVTQHPVPELGIIPALFYPNVVALANGKVLIIGLEQGIDSSDILDGGEYLIEWDSINDTFQQVEPPAGQLTWWETDSLARSADHKWAVFADNPDAQLYLYSSDADSFKTIPFTSLDPSPNENTVNGYAMNADGTKIAVAFFDQVKFLDRSFNILGATQIPQAFQGGRTLVTFTPDGSRLLLQYDLPLAIEVLNANNYTAVGYYSGLVFPEDNLERLLAVDSSGRAFAGIGGGIREVDMTAPMIPNPVNPTDQLTGTSCPQLVVYTAPLNTSEQYGLGQPAPKPGTTYYFGGQPGAVLLGATKIEVPASSISGPVDIECVGPDGNTYEYASAFSYGVQPIGLGANLLPPTGNPVVSLYGYGFGYSATATITLGGASIPDVPVYTIGPGSLQVAPFHVPNGTPGQSANVKVSTVNGSGSLAQPIAYIPSATIVPASGLLQILYDTHRNLLYALKATEVDVLNPSTLQWQSPFLIPGAGGATTYYAMALSPDGAWLAVASPNGYVAVIDPDNPTAASIVATNSVPMNSTGSITISKYNKAVLTGYPNVEIDLSSLTVTPIPTGMGELIRASSDGSGLYGLELNSSSGQVYSIDPVTYSFQVGPMFGLLGWTELAVSSNGDHFAAIEGGGGLGTL